jgi:Flp pilus assembly pilin Flp
MRNAFHVLRRLLHSEEGTEVLEWGLVAGLIVVGCIAAISLIGPKVKSIWETANTAIPSP